MSRAVQASACPPQHVAVWKVSCASARYCRYWPAWAEGWSGLLPPVADRTVTMSSIPRGQDIVAPLLDFDDHRTGAVVANMPADHCVQTLRGEGSWNPSCNPWPSTPPSSSRPTATSRQERRSSPADSSPSCRRTRARRRSAFSLAYACSSNVPVVAECNSATAPPHTRLVPGGVATVQHANAEAVSCYSEAARTLRSPNHRRRFRAIDHTAPPTTLAATCAPMISGAKPNASVTKSSESVRAFGTFPMLTLLSQGTPRASRGW
jgi:hypothetical protein